MELDRQVRAYLDLGIHTLHGWTADQLREAVTPLASAVGSASKAEAEPRAGRLAYILVIPGLPAEMLMPLTRQGAHPGYVDMRPVSSEVFRPIPAAMIPPGPYLAHDIDTGADTRNIPPRRAGQQLAAAGRHPLTIDEGLAALLLHPGLLRAANAFQLLASRDTSKRIPSLWVTKQGRPRLGWCFEGVPHSWLGAASCATRTSTGSRAQGRTLGPRM